MIGSLVSVEDLREVRVRVGDGATGEPIAVMKQRRIKSVVVLFLVEITTAIAFVVKNKFREPRKNSCRRPRICNSGCIAPAEERGDVLFRDYAPLNLRRSLAGPSFDARKLAFNSRLVKPDAEGAVWRIFLANDEVSAAIDLEAAIEILIKLRHQVFCL